MRTHIALIKKALFSSNSKEEGYVFVEEPNGRQTPIVNEKGGLIKGLEMFEGHLCKLLGEANGLVFKAKMIESMDDTDLVWSV